MILTYHSVDETGSVISIAPDVFAAHVASLARHGWRGVSLADALRSRDDSGSWPEHTVAITFDDGYRNVHRAALPVLAQHGFTATVYLVTDAVGGRNDWERPPRGLGEQTMLAWSDVEELSAAGWEIGAHTCSHADVRTLGPESLERELAGSRDAIAERLGRPVETFAYPYGHVSEAAAAAVARLFRAGVTTVLGRVTDEPRELLPRVDAYYWRARRELGPLLAGHRDAYLALRRWLRALRASLVPPVGPSTP